MFDPDHPRIADCLYLKANILRGRGKSQEAVEIYREVIRNYDSVCQDKDSNPRVALVLGSFGYALWQLGQYREAHAVLTRALNIRRRCLVPRSLELALTTNLLGLVALAEENHQEAYALFKEALSINKQASITIPVASMVMNLVNLGTSCSGIARTQNKPEFYKEGHAYFTEALEMARRTYQKDNVNLAFSLGGYGFSLSNQGDHRGGKELLLQGIAMRERLLGKQHTSLIIPLMHLGIVCHRLNEKKEAKETYTRALAICEEAKYQPTHPSVKFMKSQLPLL
jgi:tetratricopeptide (TPR) repeat protein